MKRFKSIVAAVTLVLATIISAIPAVPASAASSSSLSITPKKNYTIEPGKSVKDTLVITNLDDQNPLQLSLRVIDFTYTNDGGTPKLMLASDAPQTTWSLRPFLSIPQTVTVQPGKSTTVNMSVAIPKNQGAGSYYSAILYAAGAPSLDGANVGLSASGATLVFVSVPGKVNESLTLKKLGAYNMPTQNNPGFTFMTTQKPLSIGYTLKNAGNVTESPAGSITMKYMFGKPQTIDNINPSGSLALIGQTRTFTACIKLLSQDVEFQGTQTTASGCDTPTLWPGRYSISLDAFYGQNGNNTEEVTGTASFWYLPAWFLISFAVLVIIIALVVWRLVVKIRRWLYGSSAATRHPRRRK